jgi:GT2 family glycosyltransferase
MNATLILPGRDTPAREIRPAPRHSEQARAAVDGKFLTRGGRRLRVQGVTYGPFAPNARGEPFPARDRMREDFERMREANINAIRTYHVPSRSLLDVADELGICVLVDVPWRKHLCFLESEEAQREARHAVGLAAHRCQAHPSLLAYSIGNEIPPDVVRWHGARRVERFLTELADVARQSDPQGLVTYASYPPTEYLTLPTLDFATFNVYLHDREAFRRYLLRLQNRVGDQPLVLGELGMDTLRQGEAAQAEFLAGHMAELRLLGLAGGSVFAWTDDWHTGGYRIEDWAFGITTRDRTPKVAYHALREVFEAGPAELLPQTPRVSVVVCTYNGGRTLSQCLQSLEALEYPDYEVLVVDDGSTDNTREIVTRFANVRVIHQTNQGLSAARNVGLRMATGAIVAYTDSDCYADPDWLTLLVGQLERSGAAAVGGPNLTPEDGRLAACVAASPGQPTHVLVSDQVAEHIPGCNMAFRRDALLGINGFDPQYRKAGDDVDVCWRLQQAGMWITFAPGAFVWHHRRQNPRAYLRQQAGYGEAEALLRFKHPDQFNGRGDGKWRGVMYGASLLGLRLKGSLIYRGTFGTGLFQCVYHPAPAHWAMLPSTLEWHVLAAVLLLSGLFWWPGAAAAGAMLFLSVVVAVLQAVQARLDSKYEGPRARLLIGALCYLQPLVRSWARYRTRLFAYRPPTADAELLDNQNKALPLCGEHTTVYWSEQWRDRTELLDRIVAGLNARGWGRALDSGWSDWDIEVYCHPWTVVQISTVQENHGQGKRLIRVRYRLRASRQTKTLAALTLLGSIILAGLLAWSTTWAVSELVISCLAMSTICCGLWWRGTQRASQALAIIDVAAHELDLVRCDSSCDRSDVADRSTP